MIAHTHSPQIKYTFFFSEWTTTIYIMYVSVYLCMLHNIFYDVVVEFFFSAFPQLFFISSYACRYFSFMLLLFLSFSLFYFFFLLFFYFIIEKYALTIIWWLYIKNTHTQTDSYFFSNIVILFICCFLSSLHTIFFSFFWREKINSQMKNDFNISDINVEIYETWVCLCYTNLCMVGICNMEKLYYTSWWIWGGGYYVERTEYIFFFVCLWCGGI